ncbi:uncharacterized protein LOC117560607 [Gymnodraco acuticeps]|uniref:Uncharacterized protein LOC117560607 n=1 Tax=Gymnodraco acuticeps TaxID=8218 RepID=A0A6P8W751_GYMAC|nr:uncharacterized protein LOC117560607 [Gymnodraco acuticeps]
MLRAEPKLDSEGSVADHQYALSGAKYAKDLHPIQDKLLSYVLDHNRPGAEVIVKEGDVCLTREDFWSLGLPQCMESNIGNTCLKMVQEATQRHGKDIYIVDMYVVPTWKSKTADVLASFPADQFGHQGHGFHPCLESAARKGRSLFALRESVPNDLTSIDLAHRIAPGQWTVKFGRDVKGLPHQTTGNDCGVFILMYALNFSTDAPLWFTEPRTEVSYWTNEAEELLKGALEPVYRVSKKQKTEHEVQFQKSDMCFILELPNCLLSDLLMEVVLQEGDKAYSSLTLVCTTFRDTMSTVSFRRGAHFRWLESVATWSLFSASYKQDFNVMYTIDTCRGCLEPYKNCKPGYVGKGKRGELQGIYSDDQHPGYCSPFCNQIS